MCVVVVESLLQVSFAPLQELCDLGIVDIVVIGDASKHHHIFAHSQWESL